MPVKIGDTMYPSQDAAIKEVRRRRDKYRNMVPITGDDHRFFLDLLERHPNRDEKWGCGIIWFYIRTDPRHKNNRQLVARRKDNSEVIISYRKCVYPHKHEHDVTNAMRKAVLDQILSFQCQSFVCGETRCALSGIVLTDEDAHVDHAGKSFYRLKNEWQKKYGLNDHDIAIDHGGDMTIGVSMGCKEQHASWCAYHREHAVLQMVHWRENLAKNRNHGYRS